MSQIIALQPDVLLVERSVARHAQVGWQRRMAGRFFIVPFVVI